jgi:hypothetical protein
VKKVVNPKFLKMAAENLCSSLLRDDSVGVRQKAAYSLGKNLSQLNEETTILLVIQSLSTALNNDPDDTVRKNAAEALGKLGENKTMSGERIINTQNYYENINTGGGNFIQGDYINFSQDLSEAASQIQELLDTLQQKGVSRDVAETQVAQDMANQAQNDPTLKNKLIKWGQSLGNATVTDVAKGVVKMALRSAGLPLP